MHPTPSYPRCVAAGVLALTLLCSIAPASVGAQAAARIDSITRSFISEHHPPAMVIGVIDSTGTRIIPYGTAAVGESTGEAGDLRFEVGSVSKVFTSLLLATMVQSGDVSLDDPISRFLPDSISAPEYRGQAITLRTLATHTSGLPRLPTNIAPADMSDPYADYTVARLYDFLDSYDLPRAPDSHYEYSNLGAGLLGFLLARHAGSSYSDLLERRVLRPLGLEDTYVGEPGDSTDERLVPSHADGEQVAFWHFGPLAGAGALRSTSAELLALIDAELHPKKSQIADAIELSQEIHYRASPEFALGLAWHVVPLPGSDSASLYWHNGGTGGARSFVAFAPAVGVGLVVLMNEALPMDEFNRFALEVAQAVARR